MSGQFYSLLLLDMQMSNIGEERGEKRVKIEK